jgi:hypothetical protein
MAAIVRKRFATRRLVNLTAEMDEAVVAETADGILSFSDVMRKIVAEWMQRQRGAVSVT